MRLSVQNGFTVMYVRNVCECDKLNSNFAHFREYLLCFKNTLQKNLIIYYVMKLIDKHIVEDKWILLEF